MQPVIWLSDINTFGCILVAPEGSVVAEAGRVLCLLTAQIRVVSLVEPDCFVVFLLGNDRV